VLNDDGTVSLSEPSSKLDEVMIRLTARIEEGAQVVVFSAFKQLIYLLKVRLDKAKISYVELTGDIPTAQRTKNVEDFQAGKASVFLGTIKAGGTGIELTTSSTVMFLSREWAPNENNQAIDRLHRIGQKDSVHVLDFVTEDTIEPDKNTTIEMKWSWVEQLLGDNNNKPTFA
jgi:SNF2 family DNA or RNA helicase